MNLSHLPPAYAARVAATAAKSERRLAHLALFHFDGQSFLTEVEGHVILSTPSFHETKSLVEMHNARIAESMEGGAS